MSTTNSADPQHTQPSAPSTPRGSFFSRLFSHQESGLVLVIILMVAVLTIYGAIFPSNGKKAIDMEPDARVVLLDAENVEHQLGTIGNSQIAQFRVVESDGTTDYLSSEISSFDAKTNTLYAVDLQNRFLKKSNIVLVLKEASFFAIMAVGMTGVIILAGIDLSVGSIYAFSAIVGAMVLSALPDGVGWYVSLPVGGLTCMTVGTLCGLANGSMSVGLKVHPFVITLGMMAILRGLTIVIPQHYFDTQSISGFPESFTTGGIKLEIAGVYPVPIFVMIVIAIAGWFVLSRTVFGRRVYAIGGNETAAQYAGIPVGKVKILVYTITGALCGLSACLYLGYFGAGETNAGNAYELQVIAATVIGGASLMGGRGTAIGAVLGAVVIQLIKNALIIFDVDTSYNQIVMGAAIIIAVVIDQTKQRVQARRG